jgi:hypothetical protein
MSVVVGAVVGIELVVHALDIASAYAHNDNSQDVVDFANDVAGSVAVGSAAVDPVSAAAGTVEAEDDTLVPVPALAIEPEPE